MRREVGGGFGMGATCIPWLIHVNAWQNPPQYFNQPSLKINNFFKIKSKFLLPNLDSFLVVQRLKDPQEIPVMVTAASCIKWLIVKNTEQLLHNLPNPQLSQLLLEKQQFVFCFSLTFRIQCKRLLWMDSNGRDTWKFSSFFFFFFFFQLLQYRQQKEKNDKLPKTI